MTLPTAFPFIVWGTQSALVRFLRASGWENSTSGITSTCTFFGAEMFLTLTSVTTCDAPAGTNILISNSKPFIRTSHLL